MTKAERKSTENPDRQADSLSRLLGVMARLRDPERGCPWDVEQTFETIAPHTIEEAYEVAEAIRSGDRAALKDELGDLLLQVVFHARMAEEENSFDFNDIVENLTAKLIRRHPHVFADAQAESAEDVITIWQSVKDSENRKKPGDSALDGIGRGLPALIRALKLQKRAITARWDWKNPSDVIDKLDEETAELRAAIASGDRAEIEDELGDAFFVMVNIARKLGMDSETALARACDKFEHRYRAMEKILRERHKDIPIEDLEESQMTAGWQAAKALEKNILT